MALTIRKITGIVEDSAGRIWVNARVTLRLISTIVVDDANNAVIPRTTQRVRTDATGALPAGDDEALRVVAGYEYELVLPDDAGRSDTFIAPAVDTDLPISEVIELMAQEWATAVTVDERNWLTQAADGNMQGFSMQPSTIAADETVTIPAGRTMVVTQPFENDGAIEVNGRLVILGGAAEASRDEFRFAAVSAVIDHNNQREGVHGIADTRLLETIAGATVKADAALAAALAALLSHESDVTNPHEVTASQANADPFGSAAAAQAAAIAASVPRIPVVNYRSSTVYTFVLADDNKTVTSNSSSATTFTIPLATSVNFPTGAIIWLEQHGAGALTIAATAGVILNSLLSKKTLAGRYATAMLKKTGYNTWLLSGDLI